MDWNLSLLNMFNKVFDHSSNTPYVKEPCPEIFLTSGFKSVFYQFFYPFYLFSINQPPSPPHDSLFDAGIIESANSKKTPSILQIRKR